jgi:AraC-like DNA-binding protein
MKYNRMAPPEQLKGIVQYFWTLENTGAASAIRIPADGYPGLIFHQSSGGGFYQNGKRLSDLFLFGQATSHADISVDASITIGVCFYPTVLCSVFDVNAYELTDTCVELDAVDASGGRSLGARLQDAHSLEDRIQLITAYLWKLVAGGAIITDAATAYALPIMMRSGGKVSLKELQQKVQLSERSFERRFKQSVGISPKLFLRICNFQAALSQLDQQQYNKLSDIAFDHGYADQSHFIRTFKEFAGFSPLNYQQNALKLPGLTG